MPEKPSYLGLLNAISVAEAEAEEYLNCWADVTPRDDVRQVLRTVALREGEHAKAFAKRICELGFDVRPGARDPERASIAASTSLTDREKFDKLGLGGEQGDGPDVFAGMFADTTIDITTGALLGRYIAEERDSGRMFRACYQALCQEEIDGSGASTDQAMAEVNERLNRIEATLQSLANLKTAPAKKAKSAGKNKKKK